MRAARTPVLAALYWAASQLNQPAHPRRGGYDGAEIGVFTPVKQPTDCRDLDLDTRTYNALLLGLRCLGERGFALLVGRWRALRHITTAPRRIGNIVKSAFVLTHFEHGRLTSNSLHRRRRAVTSAIQATVTGADRRDAVVPSPSWRATRPPRG